MLIAVTHPVQQGTYKHDVRDGLGIQSYPGAGRRQDVGIWKGNKLVKLRFIIPEASMSSLLDTASSTASLELPDLKHRGKYGPKGPLEVSCTPVCMFNYYNIFDILDWVSGANSVSC